MGLSTTHSLDQNHFFYKHTQKVFVGNKFLLSPLEAMYSLLPFILCKDLQATPLQLTLMVALKPMVALLSFYGTVFIQERPRRLKAYVIGAQLLGALPCLCFPFFSNTWFFIIAFGLFMTAARAKIPAWTEILKKNLDKEERGRIFSRGATVSYLANLVVPLTISPFIDYFPLSWRWIFFTLAAVQILNSALICYLKIRHQDQVVVNPTLAWQPLSTLILMPWKNAWILMRQRPDFRHFQFVFLLGGSGLMLMHPVLPVFFKETLQLSYLQLTLATCFCKGISFAITSPVWSRFLHRLPIHLFNCYVTFWAVLFAMCIMLASTSVVWFYIAYLLYGTMQAGSELSWHLSGPIFAQEKDSTLFTGVNIAMVGLRGCLAPFLGELLFMYCSAVAVFGIGGSLCFMGSMYSLWLAYRHTTLPKAAFSHIS